MKPNSTKWGVIGFVALAVLLAGILLIINFQQRTEYPDLEKVKVSKVPQGFNEGNQPYLGDPNAKIQIMEFADYKCPACKRWTEDVFPRLKEEYIDTGKAVFYYVDFPFLAPDSNMAALAGETLYQQNPAYFWKYHELMTERQGEKKDTWATKKFVMDLVKNDIPGADLKRFEKDLDSQKYIENVKEDLLIGQKYGVNGTPTVYINGNAVEDASYENLKVMLDSLNP